MEGSDETFQSISPYSENCFQTRNQLMNDQTGPTPSSHIPGPHSQNTDEAQRFHDQFMIQDQPQHFSPHHTFAHSHADSTHPPVLYSMVPIYMHDLKVRFQAQRDPASLSRLDRPAGFAMAAEWSRAAGPTAAAQSASTSAPLRRPSSAAAAAAAAAGAPRSPSDSPSGGDADGGCDSGGDGGAGRGGAGPRSALA